MKRVFLTVCALLSAAALAAQEPVRPQTVTLTLDQAIEIALSENPTIRIADMAIERQEYVRKETVGNLLPSLSASGQYSYSIIKQKMAKSGLSFGADNTVTIGANLNVPLFVPAVYASMKLNDAQIAEAVETARSSRVNMVNEVRKATSSFCRSRWACCARARRSCARRWTIRGGCTRRSSVRSTTTSRPSPT